MKRMNLMLFCGFLFMIEIESFSLVLSEIDLLESHGLIKGKDTIVFVDQDILEEIIDAGKNLWFTKNLCQIFNII